MKCKNDHFYQVLAGYPASLRRKGGSEGGGEVEGAGGMTKKTAALYSRRRSIAYYQNVLVLLSISKIVSLS